MKIKESYLEQALKADRNDKPNRTNDAHRQISADHSETINKFRQTDSSAKEELKFSDLLESSAKPQKSGQREDFGEERRDDQRRDKKNNVQNKDSDENLANEPRVERYESGGSQTGGQGGFGMGGNIGSPNLSENFAARSILHIADLERMISIIRSQTALGGKREIVLQLKRSVLEGLQVKISTEAGSKVQLEFLAANEKVREQIEKHSDELAGILRGRGINLGSLKTSLSSAEKNNQFGGEKDGFSLESGESITAKDNFAEDNTFTVSSDKSDTSYKA